VKDFENWLIFDAGLVRPTCMTKLGGLLISTTLYVQLTFYWLIV